jgi:DNA-binding beta-propeller fold protein YncE
VQNYDNPVYLGDDEHGSLGSNLKDFAVSPRYNEIYIASGSPYGIQVVDADTLEQLSIYTTGAYPAGTAISPLGDKVYGLPASPYNNYLYEYDVETDTLINEYPLLSNVLNGKAVARGIAVDVFGEKAFVVHGNDHPSYASMELQVIDLNLQSCGD